MPTQTTHARPGRVLAGLAAFILALGVLLFDGTQWGSAQPTPQPLKVKTSWKPLSCGRYG